MVFSPLVAAVFFGLEGKTAVIHNQVGGKNDVVILKPFHAIS